MKKKAFLEYFLSLLKAQFPGFDPYQDSEGALSKSREKALFRRGEGNRREFIVVSWHSAQQKFTVEIAWSDLGRFPVVSPRPCILMPTPGTHYPEYVFRLRCGRAQGECWWRILDLDDVARAECVAEEVSELIKKQAAPFVDLTA